MLPMPFETWTTYEGHSGVDFPQRKYTLIPASGDGRVSEISYSDTGGWRVWITYDSGETLKYCHMDTRGDILVDYDERVSYGQAIARVGMLGRDSTGYHLHLENGDKSGFEAVWWVVDSNEWVGKPSASMNGEVDMPWIAVVGNKYYIVIPQGAGKPRAVSLDSKGYVQPNDASASPFEKLPRVSFTEQWSIDGFWRAVDAA